MRRTAIITAALLAASAAAADPVDPADVSFGEWGGVATSLSGNPGDAENGRVVFSTKSMGNCVSCHQVSGLEAPFQGTVGPALDIVGEYRTPEELRGIVANAKRTFPDTVMPSFYKTTGFIRPGDGFTGKAAEEPLPPLLNAQQIEDVVAFLTTLKGT